MPTTPDAAPVPAEQNDADALLELAAFLAKKGKLNHAKAELARHHKDYDDAAKFDAHHAYCVRLEAVCKRAAVRARTPKTKLKPTEDSPAFARFWQAYPRRVAKADARLAWGKLKLEGQIDIILAKIEQLKKSEQWQRDRGAFIPYPATWLNREGWNDEVETDLPGLGTKRKDGDPEGWREFCATRQPKPYPYKEFRKAADWMQSEFFQSEYFGKQA